MKKLLAFFMVVAVAVAFAACGNNNTTDPEPTPGPSFPTPIPTIQDNFDSDVMGWTNETYGTITACAVPVWNGTDPDALAGTGRIDVSCDFAGPGGDSKGAIKKDFSSTSGIDMTNKTMAVTMYVPSAMIIADGDGYALHMYIKSGSGYTYADSDAGFFWLNNYGTQHNITAPGWYTFTWNFVTSKPKINKGVPDIEADADITAVYEIGVQLEDMGSASPFTGNVSFDNITY
jgi:hypothetical protein